MAFDIRREHFVVPGSEAGARIRRAMEQQKEVLLTLDELREFGFFDEMELAHAGDELILGISHHRPESKRNRARFLATITRKQGAAKQREKKEGEHGFSHLLNCTSKPDIC